MTPSLPLVPISRNLSVLLCAKIGHIFDTPLPLSAYVLNGSPLIAVVNLPEFADLGVRGADIEGNYDMDAWIQHGYEKMIDLENEIYSKGIIAPKRGTAAYGHGMLNQRLDGIKELDDLAKISYHANDQFAKGIMTVF